jgi:hypothetical protein
MVKLNDVGRGREGDGEKEREGVGGMTQKLRKFISPFPHLPIIS